MHGSLCARVSVIRPKWSSTDQVSAFGFSPLRQRKVRKSSVLGLRRDRSWMEEDSEARENDERDEEEDETAARPPVSATLMGVVLGELGWDWANFL